MSVDAYPGGVELAQRPAVAVGDFANSTQYMWEWDVTGTVHTMLTAALHAADRLVVMNSDPNAAVVVPAQLLLTGTVTRIDSNQSGGGGGISLRGVNVRLGGEDSSSGPSSTP